MYKYNLQIQQVREISALSRIKVLNSGRNFVSFKQRRLIIERLTSVNVSKVLRLLFIVIQVYPLKQSL